MMIHRHRMSRGRLVIVTALFLLSFILLSTKHSWFVIEYHPFASEAAKANATLGFGRIYAVSVNGSPRRRRLIKASNVTELFLTIPEQPEWTETRLNRFRLREGSKIAEGSMLAWLGHLHALRLYIESGDETALFLEDDVDWDVRLRSVQVPLLSSALSRVLSESASSRYPYGDPKDWDLLYLGHCGDYWDTVDNFDGSRFKPEHLHAIRHVTFTDPTMPERSELHPWTAAQLSRLGLVPSSRLVHRSKFPLCTFAYAVTRDSALRLLYELAGWERKDGPEAYDVAILNACRDQGLRCWSVIPELFHHVHGRSVIGDIGRNGTDSFQFLPPVDAAGSEQAERRGETSNIGCGFWSGAFDFEEGDMDRLEWLRREFGRRGRCIKQQGAIEP
ncbi:glycosyltransferase family 25 protein [Ophiocordyceps camponoti-floridani]|uniref:Glycosyltransferase family 25 protein n=1 Tax=Ophiocordyceps camponoti-floridani TaxID=2030778 RepID=A0A8H4VCW8_9HYPO|nr:glycosyltransferase family 25 protein [Ophiocordyceps camponoti-floridani]